jgi:uncharacterized protein
MKALHIILDLLHRFILLIGKGVREFLILLVRGYQFFISPYFPPSCRYHPTCSNYALEAIRIHGAIKGIGLAAWRILRCNPWSAGGEDPVPGSGSAHHCNHKDTPPHGECRISPVPSTSSNDL